MVYRVFGRSGYGKSEHLYEKIEETIEKNPGRRFDIFLIVPEQHTLSAERKLMSRFGNSANLRAEAISFERMVNRVSRKTGGMIYDYADSTTKKLVMNKTLRTLEPALDIYSKVAGSVDFVDRLVQTTDELKLALISPLDLESAEFDEQNDKLKNKLKEISLIYAAYQKDFGEGGALRDISGELAYLCSLLDTEYTDYTEKTNRTEKIPKKRRFFEGATVFVDEFDYFPNGQKAVLSRIFEQADDVYVSINCLPQKASGAAGSFEEENVFSKPLQTAEDILDICKQKAIEAKDIILQEPKRFKNAALAHLEKNIWKSKRDFETPGAKFADALEIYECEKIFDEAETAAKKTLYLTREKGYRYSDIQIIAADISSYKGILDSVFEKYGIPLFISSRTQLASKPLGSMLLSLFDIINYDFRLFPIHSYLKNGLCGLDPGEIDMLDMYITAWQISGISRYAGKDWNMHPDGYVEFDEGDEGIKDTLARLNEIRKKFIAPIDNFRKNIKKFADAGCCTVKNITLAIVDFLEEINAYDHLFELSEEQKQNGELVEAAETIQIWNILMELMQKIVLVCGEEEMPLRRYSELFRFILSDVDIGKIPTSVDEVSATDAGLICGSDKKCSMILGLNADVFPQAIPDDDLFADREKQILKAHGLDFSFDSLQKSYDQLHYFYKAASSASECLILCYRKADTNGEAMVPSMALERVRGLFSGLATQRPGELFDLFELEGIENGYIEMGTTQDAELGSALNSYFSKNERYKDRLGAENFGFKDSELEIDQALADRLFYDLDMSSTKLESYVNCPFSYFCRYVLELKPESSPKLQLGDIGRFIHKILEMFMRKIRDENIDFKSIGDAYIKSVSESLIDAYLSSVIKDYEFKTDRFRYLLHRLNKTIFEIIKNLRDEFLCCDFVPADFELGINDRNDKNSVPPVNIKIPGKGSLRVLGIIDRVDIYKENKNTYIRIVDYKTGSKRFNLSDILSGLNLQMFLYLFSLMQNGQRRYDPEFSNLPAGVLYMPSRIPQYEKMPNMSEQEIQRQKGKTFERSGLFLRNEKILNAMEHNLEGKHIPVKLKPGTSLAFKKSTASSVLASLEQLGSLERHIKAELSKIARELSGGKAHIRPFKGRVDSCAFCDMGCVCRFEQNDSNKKAAASFSPDKVWDIIDNMDNIESEV